MKKERIKQWVPLMVQKEEFKKATGYNLKILLHQKVGPVLWQSEDYHVYRKEDNQFVELSL